MKILILGSTGPTGQQLISQSLQFHHEVTVLVRDPSRLNQKHPMLTVSKGNVLDKDILAKAMEGKEGVLSALGVGKSLTSDNLISTAVSLLIPTMNEANIKRLIFLSAFGVGETFSQAGFIQKIIFRTFLKNIYADKVKAEAQIRKSNLDWTLVYPVLLTDSPRTGNYKTGERLPMKGMPKISRADVADFMLRELVEKTFLKKSPILRS